MNKTLDDLWNYSISEFDVILHPKVKEKIENISKKNMDHILYDCGLDTKAFVWEVRKCTHRTLAGDERSGLLFCGRERTDKEWRNSGYATMEGLIDSTWDYELKSDLKRLNR